MRVRKHHVILGGAVIAVVLQLALAGGFFADAAQSDGPYGALAAHRVTVTGQVLGCAYAGGTTKSSQQPYARVCRYAYVYRGQMFTLLLAYSDPGTAYVDPENPSIRMSKVDFEDGPRQLIFDFVLGSSLLAGALLVTVLHQIHRVRRRRRTLPT